MKVTVRAPATTANLGPGFDCLGMALDIWTAVTVETGKPNGAPEHGLSRLVWQGVQAAFESVGSPPEVKIEADGGIPIARGLGASAALRAAGLLAGNALLDNVHDADALLAMGTRLEGHPDNMSPCLLGGFQVNARDASGAVLHQQASLPEDLEVVVFVPDFEMPTQESRRKLPRQLSREDAVFNVSRAALLVAALAAGNYGVLDEATQDRIHQPVRSEIFTGLIPIMTAAKEGGAAAAYLSGGGSTVAAFVRGDVSERVARLMTQAAISKGFSGRSIVTKPTPRGAHVV
ncbi:MAG TPA: homoserine kinase [Dehalococcoidia bacterium]|nr:homoserine kinase [Dehalococcoidia bacterium]